MAHPALSAAAPRFPFNASRLLVVILLWAIIEAGFVVAGVAPILKGDLADSDAYLQLVKASRVVETGDWYDSVLPRSNWPFGETANWTRSLDIVLLAGAALLRPFMNFQDALFWFGVALSPLCALACALAVGWMVRPLLQSEAGLAAVLLLAQPGLLSYTDPRGPNHHGILFLAFIFACGFALRALMAPENRRPAVWAGIVSGGGLWISMEFLVPVAVTLITFGLMWLVEGDRRIRTNRGFALGFALAVALLLAIERSPLTGFFAEEYDRLSIVHLTLALLVLAYWVSTPLAARYGRPTIAFRTLVAAVAMGLAAIAMLAVYPKFIHGPFADVDPTTLRLLISGNVDWQPTAPTSLAGVGRFLFYLGPSVLCIPWLLRKLWLQRHEDTAPGWLFLMLMLLAYVALTVRSLRFSAFAEIASLIPLIDLVDWTYRRSSGWRARWAPLARAGIVAAMVIGVPFIGALTFVRPFAGKAAAASDACRLAEIAPQLNDPAGLGGRQQVIVAEVHSGPEILYRTPHAVLATPMIDNPGVLAAYRILTATDDHAAKMVVDSRNVDLILLCPQSAERRIFESDKNEDTLYNRLVDGHLPNWIEPIPISAERAKHFRLFAVRRDAG